MGIHSELILEVTNRLKAVVEEDFSRYSLSPYLIELIRPASKKWEVMSPDILVDRPGKRQMVIEIESDVGFDFDQSMRQIQKYKKKYDVKVVIPKIYDRFAPLYLNDNIQVFLWSATRAWMCNECGQYVPVDRPFKPRCTNIHCKSGDMMLSKLQNFDLKNISSA